MKRINYRNQIKMRKNKKSLKDKIVKKSKIQLNQKLTMILFTKY